MRRTLWVPGMALDDDQINFQEESKAELIKTWIKNFVYPQDSEPGGPYIPITENFPDYLEVYHADGSPSGTVHVRAGMAVDKNGELIHITSDAGPFTVPDDGQTYTVYVTYVEAESEVGNFEPGYPQGGEPSTWKIDDSYQVDIAQSPPYDYSIPLANVVNNGGNLVITDLRWDYQMSMRITRHQIPDHFHVKNDFPLFYNHHHASYSGFGGSTGGTYASSQAVLGTILNAPTKSFVLLWPNNEVPIRLRLIPTKRIWNVYGGPILAELYIVHDLWAQNDSDTQVEVKYEIRRRSTGAVWLQGKEQIPAQTTPSIEFKRFIKHSVYLDPNTFPDFVLDDWFDFIWVSGSSSIEYGGIWLQFDPRLR